MSTEAVETGMETEEKRIQGGEGGTVRVRIAVAVDNLGGWAAYGASGEDPIPLQYTASDARASGEPAYPDECMAEAFHWIEADVPVPVRQTVEATTTPATPPESAVDHPSTDTTDTED